MIEKKPTDWYHISDFNGRLEHMIYLRRKQEELEVQEKKVMTFSDFMRKFIESQPDFEEKTKEVSEQSK